MPQLPPIGTQKQKKTAFAILAQINYQGKIDEIINGPVRTPKGDIAGRFKDTDGKIVYCCLTPNYEDLQAVVASYQIVGFAEDEPDTVDAFTNRLRKSAGDLTNGWLEQIKDLLDNSDNLVDFQEALTSLYPDLPIDEMSAIMAEAMTASRLAGHYEAQQ